MTVVAGCSSCALPRPISTPSHRITYGKLVPLVHNFRTSHGVSLCINAMQKKLDQCAASTTNETGQQFYGPLGLNQKLGMGMGFVGISNALLLATPLDAMADTSDATQSIFNMNMPVLLLVALIGATVGGLLARQRKAELQRLNEQLRQINAALKRQAKIESYAPALSYAPAIKIPENEVFVDPRKQELISHLKNGKNFLRNQKPENAFFEFKTALELAQKIKDPIEEKKAARGLGASMQRQGKHREAIKYHSMVLSISEREGEDSGNTEAYGAIADCYTELGDLEKAATFYDQYIARLQAD
ncbi:protein FLUORESCENT IN BLUE LIGHT, chloroplastic [Lactuca sativa]|uniref:Protein FLUORESCENT IN BLUE LIGHT, chloroplastic n=1 Tax=Lactuca sativa TaxID=4236 RepID=A0A9R1XJN2_LACSA|nr:protein FLUORESCENT IN BLUE LIGHT, chloroplastic [Lactuca sativa]KAJ0212329.1 hypothetical protein LSAT_V11C400193620 [Lactuca sativa]